jgi:hypothetical protein
MLRAGIWLLAVAAALWPPAFLEPLCARLETAFRNFAGRKGLSCAALALAVVLGRGALLVVWEVPKPLIHDEYGYLLQADTFASGRLTNATHPMAEFFETPYILQRPSYNAKFPPGQGLVLALGQIIFGNPWFGVLLSCGVLAAVLCWALQGWFRAEWALAGAMLVLPLCVFSNWMNSYWGGAVAAMAGGLVFGALPRLRSGSSSAAAIFALGATVLALTRPFEGLVVVAPLAVALLFQRLGARQWVALLGTALAGIAFLGYYNARVTGDALNMPYSEYDAQYPMTSHFNVLPLPAARVYRDTGLTWVDHWERAAWLHARGYEFFVRRATDLATRAATFLGSPFVLLPCLLFAAGWWRDWNFRVVGLAIVLTVGIAFVEVLYFDHYAAPVLAPLLILVVEGLRRLRQWKHAGIWLTRTVPMAALLMGSIAPATALLRGGSVTQFAAGGRELLEQSLEAEFGPHLVLVRHTNPAGVEPDWAVYPSLELAPVLVEFVHNGANIDQQFVVWANDRGDEANRKLLDYYKDRQVWIYSPEENADKMFPLTKER